MGEFAAGEYARALFRGARLPARERAAIVKKLARYTGLAPELRGNIAVSYYEAGHMMYVHRPSLEKLACELRRFVSGNQGGVAR